MRKKPFNWVGTTAIVVYLLGIFLFGWTMYQCIMNDSFPVLVFFNYDLEGAIIVLSIFGIVYLIIGGIVAKSLYESSSLKNNFKACPELKAYVKVVSKVTGVQYMRRARTGVKVAVADVLYLICEFPDGSRKNLQVKDLNVYNTILENDVGILTYKEYDQYILFIDFRRTAGAG